MKLEIFPWCSKFSIKITSWSLFGEVSKALATSKIVFYNKEQRDSNSSLLYAKLTSYPLSKISFKPLTRFLVSLPSMKLDLLWHIWCVQGDEGWKRAKDNLTNCACVKVAKSKECLPDYYLPLIHFFLGFYHIFFQDVRTSEWYLRWEHEEEGGDWRDVMLFAKYYIFIFLNLFVWTSQLDILLWLHTKSIHSITNEK